MFFRTNTDVGKVFGVQLITSDSMKGAIRQWDSVSTGSPPMEAISSSLTILMTCWPGVSEFMTSVPTARSSTRFTKSLTTL